MIIDFTSIIVLSNRHLDKYIKCTQLEINFTYHRNNDGSGLKEASFYMNRKKFENYDDFIKKFNKPGGA